MNQMDYGSLVSRIRGSIPEVIAIYVHGSRAQHTEHPHSDLDIALLLPRERELSAKDLLQLRGDLEALAGKRVDVSLLDIKSSLILCKEVVAYGKPLYVRDAQAQAQFEMQTLSDYARLCEDRAPVISAYTHTQEQTHG